MEGVWIFEICELDGLSRADTNKVKAFASRAVGRARPAYGRFRSDNRRQCISCGHDQTTINTCADLTGNRRFWPVKTGAIDLEALRRTVINCGPRQVTGRPGRHPSICQKNCGRLPQTEQEARLEDDPWLDQTQGLCILTFVNGYQRRADGRHF